MPKYKNAFRSPEFVEETIVGEDGEVLGTIRVKPSSILWKPKGKHKFLAVRLDRFVEWMTDPATKAREVKG